MGNWLTEKFGEDDQDGTELHHDEKDVPAAIEDHTGDGPGDIDLENPPKSDFVSFAGDNVEKEDGK